MNQREDANIDELLTSFIDEELTARQRTEVERLISHDAQAARRLRELQKCKMLVGSLPCAEAPAEMLEEIKASLEGMAPLGERPERFEVRRGARHLLFRKVLSAAAMIGLVAVLGVVIYTIVAPERVQPATGFNGRLELKTSNLAAVDSVIKKAIEDNGLKYSSPGSRGDKSVYAISCSREGLNLLLAELENIWARFDSATLFVETEVFDGVNTERIAEIVGDLVTAPKPRLTGDEKETIKPAGGAEDKEKVHLTIVIAGSK